MNTLVFAQKNDSRGSCDVFLNSKKVDGVDMNYTFSYTQAHLAIANAWHTLNTKDLKISIEGNADCGQYPVDELLEMAEYLYQSPMRLRKYHI